MMPSAPASHRAAQAAGSSGGPAQHRDARRVARAHELGGDEVPARVVEGHAGGRCVVARAGRRSESPSRASRRRRERGARPVAQHARLVDSTLWSDAPRCRRPRAARRRADALRAARTRDVARLELDQQRRTSSASAASSRGSGCPANAGENHAPASSRVRARARPASASAPLPDVVRSSVSSWSRYGTPSRLTATSTSIQSAPQRGARHDRGEGVLRRHRRISPVGDHPAGLLNGTPSCCPQLQWRAPTADREPADVTHILHSLPEGRAHRARVLRRLGHFRRRRVDPRAAAGSRARTRLTSASTTSRTSRRSRTARRSTARRSRGWSTAASCSRTRAWSRCSAARSTSRPPARPTSTRRRSGRAVTGTLLVQAMAARRREHLGRRLDVQGQRHRALLPLRPAGEPEPADLQAVAGHRRS